MLQKVLTLFAFVGFISTVLYFAFTDVGREVWDSMVYWIRRVRHLTHKHLSGRLNPKKGGPIFEGDRSAFVRDVTIPDGTSIPPNKKFRKTWEIQNTGSVVWENRYLARHGPHNDPNRLISPARVRIPYTPPGARVRISVTFVTPRDPGSQVSEWKMVDQHGRTLLPNQRPVRVSVDVC